MKEKKFTRASQSLERIKNKLDQKKQALTDLRNRLKNRRINIPLVLTSARLIIAPLIFWAIIIKQFQIAILLFIFTSLTDGLDGYLARRYNMVTKIGAILDPVADKVMINVTAGALVISAGFPWYAFGIFLIRDLSMIIVAIFVLYRGIPILKPTRIIKITTLFQVLSILAYFTKIVPLFFIVIAMIFTFLSGIDYARLVYHSANLKIPPAYSFKMLVALPDFFTLGNAGAGFISILFSFHGNYKYAAISLLVSTLFDAFDGKIARKINREGEFGKEMDSLADVLSFGVAPAIMAMSMVNNIWYFPLFFFFLSCGILRLARFNIMQERGVFYGVPITASGLLIPILYFVSVPLWAYPWTLFLLGLMMIAPIRIAKVGL